MVIDVQEEEIRNESYFYKEGITWSDVGSNASFRFFPKDCLRDNRGPAIFTADYLQDYILALLNTKVSFPPPE